MELVDLWTMVICGLSINQLLNHQMMNLWELVELDDFDIESYIDI